MRRRLCCLVVGLTVALGVTPAHHRAPRPRAAPVAGTVAMAGASMERVHVHAAAKAAAKKKKAPKKKARKAKARKAKAAAPKRPASIGTIEIPRIGLRHEIFEGVDLSIVKYGPGHWPGTPSPGGRGNTVFAGHRVTNTRPFYRINELQPGDHVIFTTRDGKFTYEVAEWFIITPRDLWIVDQSDEYIVTFFACHPRHSAKQRYVVRAKLIDPVPSGAPQVSESTPPPSPQEGSPPPPQPAPAPQPTPTPAPTPAPLLPI